MTACLINLGDALWHLTLNLSKRTTYIYYYDAPFSFRIYARKKMRLSSSSPYRNWQLGGYMPWSVSSDGSLLGHILSSPYQDSIAMYVK